MKRSNGSTWQRRMAAAEKEVTKARARLLQLQLKAPRLEVGEYTLRAPDGRPVRFSTLFGRSDELLVIHNMGKRCAYCTMWADGFNGLYDHLADRVPFVLVSPDKYSVMARFIKPRRWRFPYYSAFGTSFIKDMGFEEHGHPGPGLSTFKREKGGIWRVASDTFGPGDPYCATWHLLDMLPNGRNNWEPKFSYR